MATISEYLPYAFALIIAIPFLVLLRQFVYAYITKKDKELKILGYTAANDNRIGAFERMTLFLERIKPSNLVTKFDKKLEPHEFVFLTEKSIQEEFDYNSSQQLYISKTNWQNLVTSKNRLISLLHTTYELTSSNSNLDDFKTIFLMNYMNEGDYIAENIEELRKELLIINFNN